MTTPSNPFDPSTWLNLWTSALNPGATTPTDRRFSAEAWQKDPRFAPLAQGMAQPSPAVREYRMHMFDPPVTTLANRTSELMFDTRTVPAGPKPSALPAAPKPLNFTYTVEGQTLPASAFAERTFTDALLIIKDGRIVHEEYLNRTTPKTRFMSYSMGKSFNSMLMGMAIADGRIGSVDDPIVRWMPARSIPTMRCSASPARMAIWLRTTARAWTARING